MHTLDGWVFSHEAGLMKPDRKIYEAALRKFELVAEACVFVDDIVANVEAAEALGMRGIHHRDAKQTQEELTKLGIAGI